MKQLGRLNKENRRKARTFAKQQKAAERIAAATAQLASGVREASSAAEALRRAMEQNAAGAEQAASASEQSQRAVPWSPRSSAPRATRRRRRGRRARALQGLIAGVGQQIAAIIMSISTSRRP